MHWLTNSPQGFVVVLVLGTAIGLIGYTIPSVLAWIGHARHRRGIALLNLTLGWTVLGWIAALMWVLFDEHGNDPEWP